MFTCSSNNLRRLHKVFMKCTTTHTVLPIIDISTIVCSFWERNCFNKSPYAKLILQNTYLTRVVFHKDVCSCTHDSANDWWSFPALSDRDVVDSAPERGSTVVCRVVHTSINIFMKHNPGRCFTKLRKTLRMTLRTTGIGSCAEWSRI